MLKEMHSVQTGAVQKIIGIIYNDEPSKTAAAEKCR